MSQVIDNRVVSMEFDNSKFEKNVQTSMETLQNLNKTLDNLPETAGKNMFDGISKAAKNIDLSGISDGIEALNRKFSAFGIAGQEIIRDLTRTAINFGKSVWNTTFGQIKSGGKSRALNIAEAQFRIEGLGLNYDDYFDSIDNAVTGTAYGFDEAAVAASQFASSGVKAGEEMDHALRSISGMAAMAGRSYSDLASVMEDAAAASKISNDTFSRLAERGLPALQTYADKVGKSVDDVRKAAKKGEITFAEFARVMDEAYGEHSTKADDTFTGVTSNIRAQLSRIGQTFYQPLLENNSAVVEMLKSVKAKIKEVKAITDPFAERLSKEVLNLAVIGKGFIDGIDPSVLKPIFDGLVDVVEDFHRSLNPLVDAGKTLYTSFKSIANVGKEAFKEIFPGSVEISITKVATKFRDFVKNNLVPGEETLSRLKRIFKGMFAFDSLKLKVLKDFFKKITGYTGDFEGLGDSILETLAKIGDFFVELNENYDISKPLDNLSQSFSHLKEAIFSSGVNEAFDNLAFWAKYIGEIFKVSFGEAGGGIAGVINGSFEVIIAAIEILTDRFRDLTGIDLGDFVYKITDGLYNVKESLIEFVNTFSIVDKIKMVLNGIKNAFSGIVTALKPIGQAVGKVLKPFWDAIKDIGKAIGEGFKNPGMFLNLASMMVIFEHLRRKITFLIDDFKVVRNVLDKGFSFLNNLGRNDFVNILNTARLSIVQFTNELKANTILKIAGSIAILAVALMLLASIDENKLLGACMAMGELFIAIGVMFQMLGDMPSTKGSFLTIGALGTTMIKIAAAVLILAAAMKKLDGLEHIVDDTLVVIIMMLAFIGVAKAIEVLNIKSFNKVATSMAIMAYAVKILASAMEHFDGMNWENVIQGLVSIIVMMGALVAAGWAIEKFIGTGSFMKAAAGMIVMAAAVKMLASAVNTLGTMKSEELTQGLLALIGVMGMLVLAVMGISLTLGDGFIKTALGITMLAASVGILAHALKTIAEIDPDRLPAALWALFYVLAALVVVSLVLQNVLLQTGAGLLLVAVAMGLLVGTIWALGSMDLGALVQGVLGLAACLLVLAVALKFIQGSIVGAAALLIVSVALIPFALALSMLTALPLADLAGTILILCVALAALTVVCYAMTGAIIGAAALLVLSVALIVFGAACAILTALPLGDLAATLGVLLVAIIAFSAVGAVLSVLSPFIIAFAVALLALGAALVLIGGSLMIFALAVEILSVSGVTAATALSMFCEVINANLAKLAKAASVLTVLATALVVLDAAMIVAAVSMAACALALGLLSAAMLVFSVAAIAFSASLKLVTGSLKSCLTDIKSLLDENKFRDVAKSAITGIVKGFKEGVSNAVEAAKELGEAIVNKIKEFPSKLKEAGANAVTGFINGLKSKLSDAKQAAATLGKGVLNKLKSSLKIKSPSKETAKVGMYFDEGLAKGINDNTKLATRAASDMADDTVDAMSGALEIVANAMDSDMNPVITPEMNLSEIQNGMNSMDSLMDKKRVANISANYNARQMYEQEQASFSQAQMSNLGTQLASLAAMMAQPTPIDVHTDVNLTGGIDKFFQATIDMNNRHKKMHGGRSAYA